MNKKKVDALEIVCRNVLEQGMDPERSLAEFPEYADELRPLLQMAMDAKESASVDVPSDIARRNRARILAQAAQMREAASAPRRGTLFDFQRVAVPLIVALTIFFSSAGLIQASASALPGDNLYAVKRGWESTHFWFANDEKAANLQAEYEEERREETKALLNYRHVAVVRFEGIIISQSGNLWNIAGVPVDISADTEVGENVYVGSDVIVNGETQDVGVVLATKIALSHPEDDAILIPPTMTEEAIEPSDEEETSSEISDGDSETDSPQSDEDEPDDEDKSTLDRNDESDDEDKSTLDTHDEPKNEGTSSLDTDEEISTPDEVDDLE